MRRTRASITIVCLFAASGAGCSGRIAPELPLPPVLGLAPNEVDLGRFILGLDVDAEVTATVTNLGGGELIIDKVIPTCNCAKIRFPKEALRSGENGELSVTLRLGRDAGEHSARLAVFSSDPQLPTRGLPIKWTMTHAVRFSPANLDFGAFETEQKREASITAVVEAKICAKGIRIKGVAASDGLACELIARPPDSLDSAAPGTYWLRVELWPKLSLEEQYGAIHVLLSDAALPALVLPVKWWCRPPIVAIPTSFFLGSLQPGERVSRKAILRAASNHPIALKDVRCSHKAINVTASSAKKG